MRIKRWLRRLKWFAVGLVLLLLVAFLVLPPVVSSDWGRARLEAMLSERLGTPVRLDALDFGWTTGVVVDRLAIGEGDTVLRVSRISADPELLSLLSDEIRLRRIEIVGVDLVLVREHDGRIRLDGWPEPHAEAPSGTPSETGPSTAARLSGVVALREANVTFRDEATGARTTAENIEAELSFEPKATSLPVTLALPGVRFAGEIELFDEGRVRDEPGVRGEIELTEFDLANYDGLTPLIEGLDALAGHVSGRVTIDRSASGFSATVKDLVATGRGARLAITSGSFGPGNEIRAALNGRAPASSVRTAASGFLPDEMGGETTIDATFSGTLDELVAQFEVRLGDSRLIVENARFEDVATPRRRGTIVATWHSSLRLRRPSFAPRMDFDGEGDGDVRIAIDGRRIEIDSTSHVTNLVVLAPDGIEVRESSGTLSTKAVFQADGRLDVTSAGVTLPRFTATFEGSIADVLRTPTGAGRLNATGDLGALRILLDSLGANAPTGALVVDVETKIEGDSISVAGRAEATTLRVGERFAADAFGADIDATLHLGRSIVSIEKCAATADEASATVRGDLDLSSDRPWLDGTVIAKGDLERIPAEAFPTGMAVRGYGSLRASTHADGTWSFDLKVDDLLVKRPPAQPLREPVMILTGKGAWPTDRELPVVESAHLIAPWGKVTLAGRVPLGQPAERGRANVVLDIELPEFLKAYPALFPAGTRARGNATGRVVFTGRFEEPEDATLDGNIALERLIVPGYDVEDGRFDFRYAHRIVTVRKATARVNDGATEVAGTVNLVGDEPVFAGRFNTEKMELAPTMEPILRYATPLFALASDLSGQATVKGTFTSRGLDSKAWIAGLGGDLSLRVDKGEVAGAPMLRTLLSLLNRGGRAALRFDGLVADVQIKDGKLVTEDLRIQSRDIDIRFRGMTGLVDRSIAYGVRVKLPGKARDLPPLLRALDPDGYIPFRLGGTLTAPSLLPPDPKDIGKSLLEDALKDLLGGKRKRK